MATEPVGLSYSLFPPDPIPAGQEVPDCEWTTFFKVHGRVPVLSDERKPWTYRGWLGYYRMLCEDRPLDPQIEIPKRWDYWARTMQAGRLLDEEIPPVVFEQVAGEKADGYKVIDNAINLIERNAGGYWGSVGSFLDWLLFGFGHKCEAPKFSDELNEKLYRQLNLAPLLLEPYDYIGHWISVHKGAWNPNAFFPTPMHVCHLMTQMNFTGIDWREARKQKTMDPCVGSGRFLLAASNYSLRLYGMDIDPTMVKATLVNGYLYAPWLVKPFPEEWFDETRSKQAERAAS